jgi:hypothetical protein
MKKIDNYFVEDDFEYKEEDFHGVHLFVGNGHIYQSKEQMLYEIQIGKECPKCKSFISKYSSCEKCHTQNVFDKFKTCKVVEPTEWLYSNLFDIFFKKDSWDFLYDNFMDYTTEEINKLTFEDLQIHPCESIYGRTIEIEDIFEDSPEEFDIDCFKKINELQKLIDEANEIILSNSVGVYPIMDQKITMPESEWENIKRDTVNEYYSD